MKFLKIMVKNYKQSETLYVISKKVSCDGSKQNANNSSRHPLVYLNMGNNDFVICPYCSKYFTIEKNKNA